MLSVEGVTFTYLGAEQPALHDVSLRVEPGESVGLLGAVGSGKTTLCLALVGLVPRVYGGTLDGGVRVGGLEPRSAPTRELATRVGLVLEDYSAQLTQVRVRDEIAGPLENLGRDRAAARAHAAELLARLGLGGLEGDHKRTWELSGGQQQRLVVAAALAADPEVLILDSVTAMLDPAGKAEVRKVVHEVRGGRTLVLADHDPDNLVDVVDRVVVLAQGRVRADGPAREVLTDADLLASVGVGLPAVPRAARLLGLPGNPLTLDELDTTAVAPRPPDASTPTRRAPADHPAVLVRAAGFRYGDGTEALRDVDLELAPGEVHGLLGGNGAGKSTLARLVNRLARPTCGSVAVAGRDLDRMRAVDVAELVGSALQIPDDQLTERTVRAELEAPLRWRGHTDEELIARRRAAAADLAGLDDALLAADPMDLPFGLRKLVTIAAATVLDPPVVLLDEPGTGLDRRLRDRVVALTRRLSADGKAVLLVEHEVDLVGEVTGSVTVLAGGRVAFAGPTAEVFARANWPELADVQVLPPLPAQIGRRLGIDALTFAGLADRAVTG